jgi:prepilin-type N-terminal cleavage/methylation domain-containing protein
MIQLNRDMPFSKKSNGFTLIELLTVLAIIGLLLSLALVGLVYYKNKGRDASIQISMVQIRNATGMHYAAHKNFNDICNDGKLVPSSDFEVGEIEAFINKNRGEVFCISSPNDYVIISTMNTMDCWCLDSAGISKEISLGAGETCDSILDENNIFCP